MPEAVDRRPWDGLRVVLVHDWLTGMRGGEKVLESICRLFPEADLLHAGPCEGVGVAAHRSAPNPDVDGAAAAESRAPLSKLPAAVSGGD